MSNAKVISPLALNDFMTLILDVAESYSCILICWFQVADGVNAVLVGTIGNSPTPLVFTGGNCSIQGFNEHGDDDFWTVRTAFYLHLDINSQHTRNSLFKFSPFSAHIL